MSAGRHRGFDKDKALEKAMLVFWQNGYPGTSLSDLTNAMGINKSSLYAAFGNKESLFSQVIELYLNTHAAGHSELLFELNIPLNLRIKNYLVSIATMLTRPKFPNGCLICHTTSELAGTGLPESTATNIIELNRQTEFALTGFFEEEQKNGHISSSQSPKKLAGYLLTLQFGLAIAARNGSDINQLTETIEFATSHFH